MTRSWRRCDNTTSRFFCRGVVLFVNSELQENSLRRGDRYSESRAVTRIIKKLMGFQFQMLQYDHEFVCSYSLATSRYGIFGWSLQYGHR
jgi:hypothetical protein